MPHVVDQDRIRRATNEINEIFEQIDEELFSKDMNDYLESQSSKIANGMKIKLGHLQKALYEFRDGVKDKKGKVVEVGLLNEVNTDDELALNTARQLKTTLINFFKWYKEVGKDQDKRKAINDFWVVSRNAKFDRRTKTLVVGGGGTVLSFSIPFIAMAAAGSIMMLGLGAVFGISLALMVVGGIAAAFFTYKFSFNPHENRGLTLKNELSGLVNAMDLGLFINQRYRYFNPTQKSAERQRIDKEYGLDTVEKEVHVPTVTKDAAGHSSIASFFAKIPNPFSGWRKPSAPTFMPPPQPSVTQSQPESDDRLDRPLRAYGQG